MSRDFLCCAYSKNIFGRSSIARSLLHYSQTPLQPSCVRSFATIPLLIMPYGPSKEKPTRTWYKLCRLCSLSRTIVLISGCHVVSLISATYIRGRTVTCRFSRAGGVIASTVNAEEFLFIIIIPTAVALVIHIRRANAGPTWIKLLLEDT